MPANIAKSKSACMPANTCRPYYTKLCTKIKSNFLLQSKSQTEGQCGSSKPPVLLRSVDLAEKNVFEPSKPPFAMQQLLRAPGTHCNCTPAIILYNLVDQVCNAEEKTPCRIDGGAKPTWPSTEPPPGLVIVRPVALPRRSSDTKAAESSARPAARPAVRPGAAPAIQTGTGDVEARALLVGSGRRRLREHAGAPESHCAGRPRALAHRHGAAGVRVAGIGESIVRARRRRLEKRAATPACRRACRHRGRRHGARIQP